MNSTLSWTAVLNQNGGWRLGARRGSLHYTAPDRGSRMERSRERGRCIGEFERRRNKKRGSRRLIEMGNAEWKRRENKVEGKKDETRKGSGREGGMDG